MTRGYAINRGDGWVALTPGRGFRDVNGAHVGRTAFETFTDGEWAVRGVKFYEPETPPEGHVVISRALVQDGYFVHEVLETEPAPPPPVPGEVTMAQARIVLAAQGVLDGVAPAIEGMPDGPEKEAARIAWEYAPTISRRSTFVLAMAAALDLSDEQVDGLFRAAAEVML